MNHRREYQGPEVEVGFRIRHTEIVETEDQFQTLPEIVCVPFTVL